MLLKTKARKHLVAQIFDIWYILKAIFFSFKKQKQEKRDTWQSSVNFTQHCSMKMLTLEINTSTYHYVSSAGGRKPQGSADQVTAAFQINPCTSQICNSLHQDPVTGPLKRVR